MSVVNVLFTADEIRCYTDTMQYNGVKPVALTRPKCSIAPSGNYAVAGRGLSRALDLFQHLYPICDSLELAEEGTLSLLRSLPGVGRHGLELTLMGWSRYEGGLRAVQLRRMSDDAPVTTHELEPGVYLWPGAEGMVLPKTATDAQMIKAGLVQHAQQARGGISLCIGGLMHRTIIRGDGLHQEIAAAYPDYLQHAAELGCPNHEEYQEWMRTRSAA